MYSPLEQSILRTVAYFSVSEMPLTRQELYRYLWESPKLSYEKFVGELDRILAEQKVPLREKDGFLFPSGHEDYVGKRQKKSIPTEQKIRRARKAAKYIAWLPYLRAIFICNSVGSGTADAGSDIDFFIVAEEKRLWLVKLFCNAILRLLGLRTYGDKEKNRVCLSFFITNQSLSLAPYRVVPDDIHFAYWLHQMLPLYDPYNYYARFLRANNWTEKYLPNCPDTGGGAMPYALIDKAPGTRFKKIGETFWKGGYGDMMEKQAREIQMMKIKPSVVALSKQPGFGVVLSDTIVKLHEHDARTAYREKWLKEYEKLLNG